MPRDEQGEREEESTSQDFKPTCADRIAPLKRGWGHRALQALCDPQWVGRAHISGKSSMPMHHFARLNEVSSAQRSCPHDSNAPSPPPTKWAA